MGTQFTPIYGLPWMDDLTPLSDIAAVTNQLATKTEAALLAEGLPPSDLNALIAAGWFSDTGWQPITPAAGFAGQAAPEAPMVRRRAGLLLFQGGFLNTGMTAGGSHGIATLPVPFRPAVVAAVGAGSSTGEAVGSLFLAPTGLLTIRPPSGVTLGSYFKLEALSGVLGA